MIIKLPYKGSEMSLKWDESFYEGMLPVSDQGTTLMYKGKDIDIECSLAELEEILFGSSDENSSGNIDISSAVTTVNGKVLVDKLLMQELMSINLEESSPLEKGTSLGSWNNPTKPFHFNSSTESDDWGDLVDIQYYPKGITFTLKISQNQEESNGRCSVPYEFMGMVYEEFGTGNSNVTKDTNSISYEFPTSSFLTTRARVLRVITEYTSRFHLCCGWDAAYYCPHHTEKWERV